jgi:sulfate adenylyltransferase subunit 2
MAGARFVFKNFFVSSKLRIRGIMSERFSLGLLDELEAESIQIIREVAAEGERPVMMYSIGKDSSVLLHLARKAFHPTQIPFPLLHVDTEFKFPEML